METGIREAITMFSFANFNILWKQLQIFLKRFYFIQTNFSKIFSMLDSHSNFAGFKWYRLFVYQFWHYEGRDSFGDRCMRTAYVA